MKRSVLSAILCSQLRYQLACDSCGLLGIEMEVLISGWFVWLSHGSDVFLLVGLGSFAVFVGGDNIIPFLLAYS